MAISSVIIGTVTAMVGLFNIYRPATQIERVYIESSAPVQLVEVPLASEDQEAWCQEQMDECYQGWDYEY